VLNLAADMRDGPSCAGVIPTRPNCRQGRFAVLRAASRKAKEILKLGWKPRRAELRRGPTGGPESGQNALSSGQMQRGFGRRSSDGIGADGVRSGFLSMAARTPANHAPAHPPFEGCSQLNPEAQRRSGPPKPWRVRFQPAPSGRFGKR
jgi:hypothetical protein